MSSPKNSRIYNVLLRKEESHVTRLYLSRSSITIVCRSFDNSIHKFIADSKHQPYPSSYISTISDSPAILTKAKRTPILSSKPHFRCATLMVLTICHGTRLHTLGLTLECQCSRIADHAPVVGIRTDFQERSTMTQRAPCPRLNIDSIW